MNYLVNCTFFSTPFKIYEQFKNISDIFGENLTEYDPALSGKPLLPLFFDIETTGLSWQRSHLYMIGICHPEPSPYQAWMSFKATSDSSSGTSASFSSERKSELSLKSSSGFSSENPSALSWKTMQWMPRKPGDEKEVMEIFFSYLGELSKNYRPVLLHYNGDTFDLPYIRNKCAFYELSDPLDHLPGFDLYKLIRPYKKFLQLESLRQKSIEVFCGLDRIDKYSGKELIKVYTDYLQTGSGQLLSLLWQHNADDLAGMPKLLSIINYPLAFQGAFPIRCEICTQGQFSEKTLSEFTKAHVSAYTYNQTTEYSENQSRPYPYDIKGMQIEGFHSGQAGICLTMTSALSFPRIVERQNIYGYLLIDGNELKLFISYINGSLYHYFENYKDYYYLPEEDFAIHKSVGQFVESSHRCKANRNNCYQKSEGCYLPQPEIIFQPVFYQTNDRKNPCFQAVLLQEAEPEMLTKYTISILKTFLK